MGEELWEVPDRNISIAEFEFKEMLGKVEEKYREILILYYVEGFKLAEIADILGLNENTVKTRLARARVQIKREYMDHPEPAQRKSGRITELKGMIL